MNIKDAARSMEVSFAAGKAFKLNGAPGIGKSEIAHQVAMQRRAKYGRYFYRVVNVATLNLGSTIGFVVPQDVNLNGKTFKRGRYTYPEYFFDEASNEPAFLFERGMIVLEEWGQGGGEIKRALATLIHERRTGEYKLPGKFDIVILSNRPEDRSGVSKEFDFLINRWNEVTLEAELEPLVGHYLDIGVSESTIAFLVQNPVTVLGSKVPEKQGPWCTPRSLVGADNFVRAALAEGWSVDDPLMTENLQGIIGTGAVAQYMAFLRLHDKLAKWDDIIRDPRKALMPTQPDALMLTVYALAARVDQKTVKPVIEYMRRAPEAFAVTFVKAAIKKMPAIIQTREFGEWCRANVVMLAALNDRSL